MRRQKVQYDTPVVIHWDDIVDINAWTSRADIGPHECAHCRTYGEIVESTKKWIKVAYSIIPEPEKPDDQFGFSIIPWGCITEIVYLESKE